MSRSMSWLRSVGSPLGRGAQCLLQGNPAVPAWRASVAAAVPVRRIATDRTTQTLSALSRPFSTHKPTNTPGQTSRFKRSEASAAETPVSAADEDIPAQAGSRKVNISETVAAGQSPTTPRPIASPTPRPQTQPQPGSQAPPEPRKPVDTSSKEYKQAASKYVRFVVALPVLLVTSYFLYQRLEAQLQLRIVTADSSSSQEPSSEN